MGSKRNRYQHLVLLLLLGIMAPALAYADVIQFPDEELAAESVLPVFDNPTSVKDRKVVTASRIELGALLGYSMTEAFFQPLSAGILATYHFNEVSAVNILGSYDFSGVSGYANQLNPIPRANGASSGINANLQYAPAPTYLLLANYQYTGFYGKISLSKESVMNLSLFGLLGLGAIGIGDATEPVVSVGLGQKFYFSDRFAIRFDLRELVYQGPDILSRPLDKATSNQSASSFSQTTEFATIFSVGAVYLLPQM